MCFSSAGEENSRQLETERAMPMAAKQATVRRVRAEVMPWTETGVTLTKPLYRSGRKSERVGGVVWAFPGELSHSRPSSGRSLRNLIGANPGC